MKDYLTRRAAGYLLIVATAAILSMLGIGKAHAADCNTGSDACTLEQAIAASQQHYDNADYTCKKSPDLQVTFIDPTRGNVTVAFQWGHSAGQCENNTTTGQRIFTSGCPAPTEWNETTKTCGQSCASKPPFTSGFTPPNGSIRCANDCDVVYFYNGDGTSTSFPTGATCKNEDAPDECAFMDGYYWHSTLNVCAPIEPEDCEPGQEGKEGVCRKPDDCPAGMIEDENGLCKTEDAECPAGNIKSPDGACLPGEGQCAAGEVRGADGTCKKDGDGDGEEDPQDKNDKNENEFSGGDSCNSPPSCSGDPIMCGQARIQWRIDCNTRKNVNIAGGHCAAVPICTGEKCDAMQYASLLQQWRTACHLEKLLGKGTEGMKGAGDANGNGIPDEMEATISHSDNAGEPGVTNDNGEGMWSNLDRTGFLGGGGSCPGLPVFELNGYTFNLSESPCEQGALLGNLFFLSALLAAAVIVGRSATGAV